MSKSIIVAASAALCLFRASFAGEWENVGSEHRVSGRMISAGYLRGKVVVLDMRDYGDVASKGAILGLQTLWKTYKTKPFVVLGGHCGKYSAKRAALVAQKLGATYPVCAGARRSDVPAEGSEPRIVVFDSTGAKVYDGADVRAAGGVAGEALLAGSAPPDAAGYAKMLDYEIKNLPGRALLRLKEFRERFPEAARRYDPQWKSLSSDAEVKQLARLVELARQVKDRDAAQSAQRLSPAAAERAADKFAHLKDSLNENIVQEAKNALADIKWAAASSNAKAGGTTRK